MTDDTESQDAVRPNRQRRLARNGKRGIWSDFEAVYSRPRKRRAIDWNAQEASLDSSSQESEPIEISPEDPIELSPLDAIELSPEDSMSPLSFNSQDLLEASDQMQLVAPWGISSLDSLTDTETTDSSVLDDELQAHDIVRGGREWCLKEQEAKRLLELLRILELGQASTRCIRQALDTKVVNCKYSYDALMRHIVNRAEVPKMYSLMCPKGHFAATVATGKMAQAATCRCPVDSCGKNVSAKFWNSNISEQLKALCREQHSFEQLYEGCRRAHDSVSSTPSSTLFDYYDGALFRRIYGQRLSDWNQDDDIYVFMTMSTDGFEVFKTRDGAKSSWPIMFTLLNLEPCHRAQAANALVSAFIPGSHDSEYFESFLAPTIEDLCKLENGVKVQCYDGKQRTLRAFVIFMTADFPAASKVFGFKGHRAKIFCRNCHKEAVFTCGSLYAVPTGSVVCRDSAIHGGDLWRRDCWIELECIEKRSSKQTASVWKKLLRAKSIKNDDAKRQLLSETDGLVTGIKKVPLVSRLSLDFVFSFPYDPMHLCLLGWVKHLLTLVTGDHKQHRCMTSSYILREEALVSMDKTLSRSSRGVPSSWGRPPLSVRLIRHFKAEDFKNFGMMFAKVLWHGLSLNRRHQRLWLLTAKMLEIFHDPTPSSEDWIHLRAIVQSLHALFTHVFYEDERHAFCFTPTTHAILHLPELLRECGPLTNVSQFVVERFVGEVGVRVKSRKHPDANLFHKSHTLFCLRLLGGGIQKMQEDPQDERSRALDNASHANEGMANDSREREALDFFKSLFPDKRGSLRVLRIKQHKKTRICKPAYDFLVETKKEFSQRENQSNFDSRQKCCIVGVFGAEGVETGQSAGSVSEDDCSVEAFFGYIDEIWEVEASYKGTYDTSLVDTQMLLRVDWEYGIIKDEGMEVLYKEGHSTQGHLRTVESVKCVDRLLGFMDVGLRRYFLDQSSAILFSETGEQNLKGVRKTL